MKNVFEILVQIGSTSSRNEKMAILKANEDNSTLIKVFEYTYNPYKVYGIGKKSFKYTEEKSEFTDIFALLDYLLTHDTGSDVDKAKVNAFVCSDKDYGVWYRRMILKDLKVGVTATTLNKVWPGLIPSFDVMLAFPFNRLYKKVAIEPKIDGCRCVAIKQGESVHLFTRNGKKIEGFTEIENDLRCLPIITCVFDGEIVGSDYKDTMNQLFAKGGKKQATYMIFDMLTLRDFQEGSSTTSYLRRKNLLLTLRDKLTTPSPNLEFIAPITVLEDPTVDQLKELMKSAIEQGYEGIMVKAIDGTYECKRSYLWQKMKLFETNEFKIVDYEEGEGRLQGMLGKVIVDVDGVQVGVGSGFNDEERVEIWGNREKYMGKLIEVQYQEKTPDGALRFPTVKGFRFDIE